MFAHSERIEADAKLFVDAGATAAGDEERRDRIKAVEDSFATFRAGGKVEGFPRLTEYIDERVARRAAEWLGILGKFGTRNQTAEDGSPSPHANSNRPTIRITAGDIERIVDEAEDALISAERGVYQRDATIVSVCEAKFVTANTGEVVGQRVFDHAESALAEDLCAAANFEKFDGRTKAYVRCDPPSKIVKTLCERKGHLRLLALNGITHAPISARWLDRDRCASSLSAAISSVSCSRNSW